MNYDINAQVIIGESIDITSYVESIDRVHSICSTMQTGHIVCSPNLRTFLNENELALTTYQDVHIYEFGVKVLTGYITRVTPSRKPDATITIGFADKYKRAKDYFIDNPDYMTSGQSVSALAGELLGLCDLNLIVDSGSLSTMTVPPEQPLGLSSVDDALQQILAYGTGIAYVDGNGDVHILKGTIASTLAFATGPLMTDGIHPSGILTGNILQATVTTGDENARDVVKVWGMKPSWDRLAEGESPYIVAERSVDLGLPVPKTILYSSSIIQTDSEANRLADDIIQEVGKLDQVIVISCLGNPYITVGKRVSLNIDLETSTVTGNAKITSVKSIINDNGYTMIVSLDEFCPKFAGWSLAQPPKIFYAGTTKLGVYKSYDGAITWIEYNTGLPSGVKSVRSLAATQDDEVMAIINNQLWYTTTSGQNISNPTWVRKYLSAPENLAGDYPAPTASVLAQVDSPGTSNTFTVLTNYTKHGGFIPVLVSGIYQPVDAPIYRSWVYETSDTGNTWYNTQISAETPSGISYSFHGVDLSNRYGTPWVTTVPGGYEDNSFWAYKLPLDRAIYWNYNFDTYYDDIYAGGNYHRVSSSHNGTHVGIVDYDFYYRPDGRVQYLVQGNSPNRIFTMYLIAKDLSGWPVSYYYTDSRGVLYRLLKTPELHYAVYSGPFLMNNYDPLPISETLFFSPSTYNPDPVYYPHFQFVLRESDYGSNFTVKFSFYCSYSQFRLGDSPDPLEGRGQFYRTYSGERRKSELSDLIPYPYFEAGFPYEAHYPDPNPPIHWSTPDMYSINLSAGWFYVDMDRYTP